MDNILFMGDSLTSGDNNSKISFVNYVNLGGAVNLGVSGTTVGEYSIYPTDGYSLLSLIQSNKIFIQSADEIYLEYGANDASALIMGNVSYNQVLVSFVKAIDAIKQINPDAKIYFLVISFNKELLKQYSMLHVDYLLNDYFKGYDIHITAEKWYNCYLDILKMIEKKVQTIPLFLGRDLMDNLDEDNIHPNDTGYQIAASNLEMFRKELL